MVIDFKNLNIKTRAVSWLHQLKERDLKTLELHNLVDSNTPYLYSTFGKCTVENIRFLNCTFKNVDKIQSLFSGSQKLKSITVDYSDDAVELRLSGLFPKVLEAKRTFENCKALEYADISKMFKSGTLCSICGMFDASNNLKYVNLEEMKFDTVGMMNDYNLQECGALQLLFDVNVRHTGNKTIADKLEYIAVGNIMYFRGLTVRMPKDTSSRKVIFGNFTDDEIEKIGIVIDK